MAVEDNSGSYSSKELKNCIYFLSNILNKNHSKTVAVIGEPSFLTAVSVLSVLLSEAVYIPIEPSWPLKRIKKILQHSGADTVLSQNSILKKHSLDFKDFSIRLFLDFHLINKNLSSLGTVKNFPLQTTQLNCKPDLQATKQKKKFCVIKYLHSGMEKTLFSSN